MRKTKLFKLDDREIIVKELRVRDIMELFGGGEETPDMLSKLRAALPRCVDGVTLEDLQQMAPSEIKTIYEAFREINDVFFGLARQAGLSDVIEAVKQSMREEFSAVLADSLKRAMPPPSITDTAIS